MNCWRLEALVLLLIICVLGVCRCTANNMNQLMQTGRSYHVNKMLTGFSCRRSLRALSSTNPHTAYATDIQNINQRKRRRRGAIHATKRIQQYDNFLLAATISDDEQPSTLATTTQYTINDSICPPTDTETLNKVVIKHIQTLPKYWKSKPIAKHTSAAFTEALDFILQHPKRTTSLDTKAKVKVIIDGGCGTGRSSYLLGEIHKDCLVIGIDQSLSRLSRNKGYNNDNIQQSNDNTNEGDNVLLLRAELADFWKCILSSPEWQKNVQIQKHYLLYPNPYPKKSRLKNRWYAHPAFPLLMMTTEGAELIMRSNWEGYLKEFSQAVNVWSETGANYEDFHGMINSCESDDDEWHPTIASSSSSTKLEVVGPDRLNIDIAESLTNFEAKYVEIGEPIYELKLFQKAIR